MSVNANEWLLSSGVRSAAFTRIGDHVVGHIMSPPEVQQQRDFDTGQPKFWSDGNPMLQVRVVLITDQADPADPEDSGERALYVRGNLQRAVAQAVRQAGAKGLEVGGKLLVRYAGDGQAAKRGFNPPKLYEARYQPPDAAPVAIPDLPDVSSEPIERPTDGRARLPEPPARATTSLEEIPF